MPGTRDEDLRAGDADRERALTLLREASVDGRLTIEELTERAELVQRARTHGDLAATTADLAPAAPAPAAPAAAAEAPGTERAVLSSLVREGRWRLARRSRYVAVMGSVRLDLRQAALPGPEVEIEVRPILGSAEILLPEGVHVEVIGSGFMSSCEVRVEGDPPAGAPIVRIRAGGALGSVAVRSRPSLAQQLMEGARRAAERLGQPPPPPPPPPRG